jgi:hypothetical protein
VLRLLGRLEEFSEDVCYVHLKALGGHVGLMVKRLGMEDLRERLLYVNEHRLRLGALKSNDDTYRWFRVANRPPRPSDRLGPYRFAPIPTNGIFEFDLVAVLGKITRGFIIGDWLREGSINVDYVVCGPLALRPDRQWRLVTYPYYTKYALPGDNTYFRHIDIRIPELLASGRGVNMAGFASCGGPSRE